MGFPSGIFEEGFRICAEAETRITSSDRVISMRCFARTSRFFYNKWSLCSELVGHLLALNLRDRMEMTEKGRRTEREG